MGAMKASVSAVVAGAMTASVAAVGVAAAPEPVEAQHKVAAAELAAVSIPILDFGVTVGPLTVSRLLELVLASGADTLSGTLNSGAGTAFSLAGVSAGSQRFGQQVLSATRVPGELIGASFNSNNSVNSPWSLFGLAAGKTETSGGGTGGVALSTGGSQGIGGAIAAIPVALGVGQTVEAGDVTLQGLTTQFLGGFSGEVAALPFDGFRIRGTSSPANVNGQAGIKVGSLQFGGGGSGSLGGDAGLCLGSAAATCGNRVAYASGRAPVSGGVPSVLTVDIPNNLAVAAGQNALSVTGEVGGVVNVGSVSLGRKIPINFSFPNSSSSTLSKVSGGTGGKHRAPVRDAINEVKNVVNKVVSNATQTKPRHAAADTAD